MQTLDRCGGGETGRASGGATSAAAMCSAPRMPIARKRAPIVGGWPAERAKWTAALRLIAPLFWLAQD